MPILLKAIYEPSRSLFFVPAQRRISQHSARVTYNNNMLCRVSGLIRVKIPHISFNSDVRQGFYPDIALSAVCYLLFLKRLLSAALAPVVTHYITSHRDRLSATASPLPPKTIQTLERYFHTAHLERVRIVTRDPLPLADPPFTNLLRKFRFSFPGLAHTEAITLGHVIASREPMPLSLLFHELVHVVQFEKLGIRTLSKHYVHGFLSTRNYYQIPLERCAYDLTDRFSRNQTFSVEAEVDRYFLSNFK